MKVVWRIHLNSPVEDVYSIINSDDGRAKFWAEKAVEIDNHIHFEFINGWTYKSKILKREVNKSFTIVYFSATVVFELVKNEDQTTDLFLTSSNIPKKDYNTVHAGWVSILLAMKAACDHGVDLRNHNPEKCWDQGFADN